NREPRACSRGPPSAAARALLVQLRTYPADNDVRPANEFDVGAERRGVELFEAGPADRHQGLRRLLALLEAIRTELWDQQGDALRLLRARRGAELPDHQVESPLRLQGDPPPRRLLQRPQDPRPEAGKLLHRLLALRKLLAVELLDQSRDPPRVFGDQL